jgi:acetylornithine/succinyldiaminopimelate/putrescine aminotransferase
VTTLRETRDSSECLCTCYDDVTQVMGEVLKKRLQELQRKYMVIGDVRGLGLFQVMMRHML